MALLLGVLAQAGPAAASPASSYLAVNDLRVLEGNAGTTPAAFTVTRTGDLSTAATVKYSVRGGPATRGSDFTIAAPSGTLIWAAGEATKTVAASVLGDALYEKDETFKVTLSAPQGAALSDSSGTATIVNDDAPAYLTVGDTSVVEGNGGSATATFTITRSGNLAASSTVSYKTSGGTAIAGTDYTAVPLTPVTFSAGQTTKTVAVDVTGDAIIEPNETIHVLLSKPSAGTVVADVSGTATIVDDDNSGISPAPATFFSVADFSVIEGTNPGGPTPATFTVTRTGNIAAESRVTVNSVEGLGSRGTATPNVDYTPLAPTTLTFPAGDSSPRAVTVNVAADSLAEATETIQLALSEPLNDSSLSATVSDPSAIATIVNDDGAAYLTVGDIVVTEGNADTTSATFTVTRSGNIGSTSTVKYATGGGTATAGATADYLAASSGATPLSFAPGETTQTVTVQVNGDTTPEANETFDMLLSSPTGATISDAAGIATIVNDD